MGNFSFSSLGVLFLLLVLIPNACWCFKKPKDDTAERENRWLQTCEQRGKLKKVENLEMSTVGRGIWQEN